MRFSRYKSERYLNGNYIVKTSSYGNAFFSISKRALRIGEELISEFPDSIDLKISDRCSHGCPFCHESSTPNGNILNLDKTKQILSQLPTLPIEIAVGGGNVLECLDETEDILNWLLDRGHKTRLTITLDDLKTTGNPTTDKRIIRLILDKIEGLGVSVTSLESIKNIKKNVSGSIFKSNLLDYTDLGKDLSFGPKTVYHVIAGITPVDDIKKIIEQTKGSVLVLGYKQWGRAKNSNLPDLTPLKNYLHKLISSSITNFETLGFDNLAIEQLEIKKIIGENIWKGIYLGDEGTCSMYIDAVKGEFAKTSRSSERVKWDSIKLLDYYAKINPKRKI